MKSKLLTTEVKISPHGFVFCPATKQDAIALLDSEFNNLAKIAYTGGFESTTVYYPGCKNPVEIYANQYKEQIEMPQNLHFGSCTVAPEFLPVINTMGESDQAMGLVDAIANRQMLLSEGCRVFTPDLESMVSKRRSEYWFSPDLAEFDRRWRRDLRDDGSNWLEFSYLCFPLNQPTAKDGWKRFTNRFSLIVDRLGNPFHLCQSVASESVAAPA